MTNLWFGAIVLAAGSSTRMGRPKQLLKVGEKTLVRNSAETVLSVHPNPIVVTGAVHQSVQADLMDLAVTTTFNADWQTGMASSLQCGLKAALDQNPAILGLLMTLVDQPYVTVDHLNNLLVPAHSDPQKALVVTAYAKQMGVPAFIGKNYFNEIRKIKGDQGARSLFMENQHSLSRVLFPAAARDIDTPDDWLKLLNDPPV